MRGSLPHIISSRLNPRRVGRSIRPRYRSKLRRALTLLAATKITWVRESCGNQGKSTVKMCLGFNSSSPSFFTQVRSCPAHSLSFPTINPLRYCALCPCMNPLEYMRHRTMLMATPGLRSLGVIRRPSRCSQQEKHKIPPLFSPATFSQRPSSNI